MSRDIVVRLSANVSGYTGGMARADAATAKTEAGMARLNKRTLSHEQAMGRIGKVGGRVFLGAAAGIAIAEKKAADFNSEMATVYTLSHANTRQQDLLAKSAKTVGVNIGYSATESAAAQEELIKAGVKLKDILGGGLKGALDLAAAGQTDVGTATEVAASAMTQFKLKGKDVPHIADLLAAGADKALGSVTDLGYGLSQAGTTAHQMGLSIEDTTGTLAEFAQNGLIGERGGTTLKMMLLKLANPTDKAASLMDRYGLSIYKANGQMKTMPEIAGNLQRSFKDLDPAQRNAALGTIFGSRAIQAANILIKEGEKGNRRWIKSVDDQGFAAKQAGGKMNSLKGDLQKLDAQLGNALIDQGGKQGFLRGLTQDATKLVKKYNQLSDAQKRMIGKDVVKVAAAGGLLWAANKVLKISRSTAEVYRAMFKTNAASSAIKAIGGGGLGKKAGVVPVYVTNWGKGSPVPPASPTGPKSSPGGPGLVPLAADGAAGGGLAWSLLKRGGKAPDLTKLWAEFQERSFLENALKGVGSRVGGAAGLLSLGDAGNEVLHPGQRRGGVLPSWLPGSKGQKPGATLLGPDQLTPADIARLSDAQKHMLGLDKATRSAAQSQQFASAMWKTGYNLMGAINPSMGKFSKTLQTIPKDIRFYVSTPGAVTSVGMMRRIATEYKLTPKQVRTVMELQGFSETKARIAAAGKSFQALPKQVKTALRADTVKSVADVKRLQATYHLTPRQVRTVMQVSGVDRAIAQARALRNEIAAIKSKSVTISIHRGNAPTGPSVGKYSPTASADGSTVPKTGLSYADRHHYLLADGEEVVSNRHGQADRHRGLLKAINANRLADGGTVGAMAAISGGTGTQSVTVTFPAPAVYTAAVKAANQIAVAAVKTTATAKDLRAVHLDDLHQQQQIRDLQKSLAEHNKKTVGKGKHRHTVQTGFTLTGLDRRAAKAELADAKANLSEMRKITDAQQQALDAQKQARTDAKSAIVGGLDFSGRSAGGALTLAKKYEVSVAKYGSVMAQLRSKKAAPGLLQKVMEIANNGDYDAAARFGQSLLDQPAVLGSLNTEFANLDKVVGGVANLTTDPRFLGTQAWNPVGQVASTKQVQVLLAADPSTWMTTITNKVTANVLQAMNGGR